MTKKYKLTHHTKEILGHTLHQIKAVKSFDNECTLMYSMVRFISKLAGLVRAITSS